MIGVRYESYESLTDKLPFTLYVNLERVPNNCSKEQNWHDNLEIQLCTEGKGTVLLNGEKYNIKKNDIVVVNSNVIHYTATENSLTYSCLIVSTDWCRRMGIDFEGLSYTPIINDTTLQNYFCELISIYSTHNTNMRVAKVNQVLLKMLIYLTENYSSQKNSPPAENRHFEKVKETVTFIQQNYNRKITLDEISKVVLYDKFALCKIFKTLTGQTITENLNRYRSLRAIDLLSEGYTISETAFMCGFNNLSFFTKTFKKYVGKNPSNYKKKKPAFL